MRKHLTLIIFCLALLTDVTSQDFYDINTINTVEITFLESNWDQILDQYYAAGDEERLVGTVSINGQVFDSAGIRYKGNSTYNANQVKNPLNIKLDHIIDDQTMDGYGTLKLANVYKDPSFVREVLAYEIARKYFPASQANFTNVYINGTHLGLYTSDQSVDKFFMRTHIGSDENTRVKGELTSSGGPPTGGVWEYYGEDSASYANYYDMKSDYGWDELIDFLAILNNNNTDVDESLNTDRHLWFLAFSNLLVNLDGPINNPQNYYLYKDDNGRFNPIPWDLNESFGVFTFHQSLGPMGTNQLQQFSPFTNLNESEYPIISKILTNDTYRKMYVAHMRTILEENFANGLYETRALEIQDIIDADVQADQNKFYTYSNFTSNLYNQVGGGPQSIIGIVQLMDTRTNYIQTLSDFQYDSPEIANVAHQPENVSPLTEVWFTADLTNTVDVYLAHRSNTHGIFEKTVMYDDGNHNDGQAGDGKYGVSLIAGSTDIQYYIYAENTDAVAFSPVRAEYEFYDISITSDLVINEFMADNENAVADQDGEFDDWIEFYNNSDTEVSLGGYYLTDDASEPDQWVFPDTIIDAGGYLIVWADKDEDQDGLHANFKLSASGEAILLSNPSLGLIDQVNYLQQKPDTTTGRYLNGVGDFTQMLPTFGYENSNILTIFDELETRTNTIVLKQNYPNPFDGVTNIDFVIKENSRVVLTVQNLVGENIATIVDAELAANKHSYNWDASNVKSGLYFYSLNVDGATIVKKMIVK